MKKSLKLFLNDKEVIPPECIQKFDKIEIDQEVFNLTYILWEDKPGTENSKFYFVTSEGRVNYSENTSLNKKSGFYLSTYVQSNWIDRFEKNDFSLNLTGNDAPPANLDSPVFSKLKAHLKRVGQEIYLEFLRAEIDRKIVKLEEDGAFPSYSNLDSIDSEWRRTNLKSVIREIWLAEPKTFNSLRRKPLKIIFSLLDKLLVSNENDSLLEVLESVMELDDVKIRQLSNVLHKTTMENVISTIETLQRREEIIRKLQVLMVAKYKEVLETPHLQKIIEANTWLFGEQYAIIGAEEDDFQKTALNLREQVSKLDALDISDCDPEDLEEGLEIEGVRRQVDLFLARKKKDFENGKPYFKCTIIEIKKPSIALNKKHLRQLEDYADIIAAHPGFSHANMRFELILVGRKISSSDNGIQKAWDTSENHNESGLVFKQPSKKIKGFVKTWATITQEFELSNDYLLDKLKTKRDSYSHLTSTELVIDLQKESL